MCKENISVKHNSKMNPTSGLLLKGKISVSGVNYCENTRIDYYAVNVWVQQWAVTVGRKKCVERWEVGGQNTLINNRRLHLRVLNKNLHCQQQFVTAGAGKL